VHFALAFGLAFAAGIGFADVFPVYGDPLEHGSTWSFITGQHGRRVKTNIKYQRQLTTN
jgi:hypothetical protein